MKTDDLPSKYRLRAQCFCAFLSSLVFRFSVHHKSTLVLLKTRCTNKHCSTMYSKLTINFLNHFKCFCGIKMGFPAKTNRYMLFNCFPITIYDTAKTDKLHHITNMFFTANSLGLNLVCAEKRVYQWTSPSFMKIALLLLCFRSIVAKLTRLILYQNSKKLPPFLIITDVT